MEEEIVRLGCQVNELFGDSLYRHGQRDNCIHIKLVYLYSRQSNSAERSPVSRELIPLILDEYGIRGQYYFIAVTSDDGTVDLEELGEFMASNRRDIVLFVNALGSDLIYSIVQYFNDREYTNYLVLNSVSTLDNNVLNSPRVIRVIPRDGSNALLFKAALNSVQSNNRLLLVDESNGWAVGLADDIQTVTNNIRRLDLNRLVNGTIQLPSGTLSIIALAEPSIPSLMQILPQRSADVRLVLLGDGDNGISPQSIRELQYLTAWNTRMIVPKVNTSTIDEFVDRTGFSDVSNLFGPLVSILQLATYIKYGLLYDSRLLIDSNRKINALHLLPSIRNYFMGIELDELSMDMLTGTYDIVSFSSVGLPATTVSNVGVSIEEEDEIQMYLGRRV